MSKIIEMYRACLEEDVTLFKSLMNDGRICDLNAALQTHFGATQETILGSACRLGQTEIVILLLNHPDILVNKDNGPDTNMRLRADGTPFWINNSGKLLLKTPFQIACLHNQVDIVKILLSDPRVEVNYPYIDHHHNSLVHSLCGNAISSEKALEILAMLLADGRIDILDVAGKSPLAYHFGSGRERVIALLIARQLLTAKLAVSHASVLEVIAKSLSPLTAEQKKELPIFFNDIAPLIMPGIADALRKMRSTSNLLLDLPLHVKDLTPEETIEKLEFLHEKTQLPAYAYHLARIYSGLTYGLLDSEEVPYDEENSISYYKKCIASKIEPWSSMATEDLACFLGGILNTTVENEFQKQVAFMLYYEDALSNTSYRQGAERFRESSSNAFTPEEFPIRILKKSSALPDKTPASPYNSGALVLYRKRDLNQEPSHLFIDTSEKNRDKIFSSLKR